MSFVTATAGRLRSKDKTHKIGITGRVKLLVFKVAFGHAGGLAAIGAYFFLTQLLHGQHTTLGHSIIVFPDVKGAWDHLLDAPASSGGFVSVMSHGDWNTIRHLIRPLYEGIFASLLFGLVGYNPFKTKTKPRPGPLSRIAIRSRFIPTMYRPVTALQIVLLPLTITLFSIPGVAAGYGVDQGLRSLLHTKSLAPTLSANPSVVQKFYSGAFDAKIIGIFASFFFASKAALPVFNFVLRYYAQRRVLNGKQARFYHPPAFKLLVRDYAKAPRAELVRKQGRHSSAVKAVVPSASFVIIAMAGLGYWVLRYVAG